jgi:hypothetical protein
MAGLRVSLHLRDILLRIFIKRLFAIRTAEGDGLALVDDGFLRVDVFAADRAFGVHGFGVGSCWLRGRRGFFGVIRVQQLRARNAQTDAEHTQPQDH